jgi:hypothetical protein
VTLDPTRRLIIHGADPVKWARRYGIQAFTADCYGCGAARECTLPFAQGKLRGLIAPVCECGKANPPYCMVSATGGDVLNALRDDM